MPFLNEEAALKHLLSTTPADFALVLVDNGSSDASRRLVLDSSAVLLDHDRFREVGACIELGVARAQTDVVCVMDCDATVDMSDTRQLLRPVLTNEADFVVGTRASHSAGWTLAHRASSRVRDSLTRRVVPDWPFVDLGSARAFRRSAIDWSRAFNTRFGWNLDFTVQALESLSPDRIASVELPFHRRLGPSHISGSIAGALTAMVDQSRVLRLAQQRTKVARHESHNKSIALV
ncbi:hypothetical protein CEP17_11350 [Microbacterium sp. PM5]|nr:hypothetical protein CEP17_11350 [Microbacterium sp. PM5]